MTLGDLLGWMFVIFFVGADLWLLGAMIYWDSLREKDKEK